MSFVWSGSGCESWRRYRWQDELTGVSNGRANTHHSFHHRPFGALASRPTGVILVETEGVNDGTLDAFLGSTWGRICSRSFVAPDDDAGNHLVRVDKMNTITLTRAEFDALPTPPTAAPKPKKGARWKHLYHGQWFVAEYVEVATDVLGIEFREVVIEEEAR